MMKFDLKKFGGDMIENGTEVVSEVLNETKEAMVNGSRVLVSVGLDLLNSSTESEYEDYDMEMYGSGDDQDYGSSGHEHAKVNLTSLVDNVLVKVRKMFNISEVWMFKVLISTFCILAHWHDEIRSCNCRRRSFVRLGTYNEHFVLQVQDEMESCCKGFGSNRGWSHSNT